MDGHERTFRRRTIHYPRHIDHVSKYLRHNRQPTLSAAGRTLLSHRVVGDCGDGFTFADVRSHSQRSILGLESQIAAEWSLGNEKISPIVEAQRWLSHDTL